MLTTSQCSFPWSAVFFCPFPYSLLTRSLSLPVQQSQTFQREFAPVVLPPLKGHVDAKGEAESPVQKSESSSSSSSAEEHTSLDSKLDFIVNSTNRTKPSSKRASTRRARKTPAQLEILEVTVSEGKMPDHDSIRLISEKTKLSIAQVYKWIWDCRKKKRNKDKGDEN